MKSIPVRIGKQLVIGGGAPIAVQTMCNTHTSDVEATLSQCRRMAAAGADVIRITVPGPKEVDAIRTICDVLRSEGIGCNPAEATSR